MKSPNDLLDHATELFPEPDGALERLRTRHARRQRNRRLAVLGTVAAIWVAFALAAIATLGSRDGSLPAQKPSPSTAPTPPDTESSIAPDPSTAPTAISAILEGVEVDVSAPGVEPRMTPREIARIALDAIAAYERQVGTALAPRRLVSITLVAPGEIVGSVSQTRPWWAVRFEGTIVMWGGSSAPANFGYQRGSFGIDDATGEIQTEGVQGRSCFVLDRGEPPPGFEDTPACRGPRA